MATLRSIAALENAISILETRGRFSVNLEIAANNLLRVFADYGFTHVMISILDKDRNVVKAIVASGDLRPLVPRTVRDVHGDSVAADDDVLVFVVKTGLRQDIDDCFAEKSRCDHSTLKSIDPPLHEQIILPLRGEKGFGWSTSRVFGTIQIGRLSTLNSEQEHAVECLTRYSSLLLEDVLLSAERNRLLSGRERQLEMLKSASAAITCIADIDKALAVMLGAAVRGVGAQVGSIRIYDDLYRCLMYRAVFGEYWRPEDILMRYTVDDKSTAGWVVNHQRPLLNPDTTSEKSAYIPRFQSIKSNCGVPIFVNGKAEGALVLDSDQKRAFSVNDISTLQAFSALLGNLIASGRTFSFNWARQEIGAIFSRNQNIDTKLSFVARAAREALRADHCSIFTISSSNDSELVLAATTSPALGSSIGAAKYRIGEGRTGWVAARAQSLRVKAHVDIRDLHTLYGTELQPRSQYDEYDVPASPAIDFLAVPIKGHGIRCWGVIRCVVRFDGAPNQLFSQDDEQLLTVFGEELAAAMERSKQDYVREQQAKRTAEHAFRVITERVSHRLKNPTNLLMEELRICDHVLADAVDKQKLSESFAHIHRYARSIKQTVTELNDWLVTPKVQLSNVDVAELVRGIARGDADRNIEIVIGDTPSAWPKSVKVDRRLLEAVIEEIVANAKSAISNKGKIEVAFAGPFAPAAGPFPEMRSEYVSIVVSDSGPGVPPAEKERIFHPYVSNKANGTGIGLSIVRNYLSALGGYVSEDGVWGSGARFNIAVPILG